MTSAAYMGQKNRYGSPAERLTQRVTVTADGCHEWQGALYLTGYGRMNHERRRYLAHRLAWETFRGPIPDGMCVCHDCDNRKCVNVEHLFLGTIGDNNRDMWSKGRGVANPVWRRIERLTPDDRAEIVRRRREGEPTAALAAEFGITRQYVWQLARRATR